jgi:phosphohistidine phosphatase
MRLHLIRHGDANTSTRAWGSDGERPLTTKGHAEARRAGEALTIMGAEPDLVLTSPLVRARQTAEDLCAALGTGLVPNVTDVLAPGAEAATLIEEIATMYPGATEVVCAGHMPDMGHIAAQFAGPGGGRPFRLKTGTLIRIDLDGRETRIVWMMPPNVIRRLTRT